jgi:hypothetical protein
VIFNTKALGRLKTGEMNKTEARYATELETRRQVGDIAWWKFEALKFRLADNTFFSPDFIVMLADGTLEAHEVKGKTTKTTKAGVKYDAPFALEDARAKIKIAAELFPIQFVVVYPATGGGWNADRI